MKKRFCTVCLLISICLLSACGQKANEPAATDTSAATSEKATEAPSEKPAEESKVDGNSSFSGIVYKPSIPSIEPVTVPDLDFDVDLSFDAKIEPIEKVKSIDAEAHFASPDTYMDLNMTEAERAKFDKLSDAEKEAFVIKKTELLNALIAAFQTEGISVSVDTLSGEIIFDSSVLFANDQYAVSADGKAFLNKFIAAYAPVITHETYRDFVSQILVEGHTDTNGDYDYNLTLSQHRADSVKTYCLSSECTVSQNAKDALSSKMLAKGFSFDRPVKNADGSVNMDASRRVTFRFLVQVS